MNIALLTTSAAGANARLATAFAHLGEGCAWLVGIAMPVGRAALFQPKGESVIDASSSQPFSSSQSFLNALNERFELGARVSRPTRHDGYPQSSKQYPGVLRPHVVGVRS